MICFYSIKIKDNFNKNIYKMLYNCCSDQFYGINSYLQHLKVHKNNDSLQVKCNECGNTSTSWLAFKRHVKRDHTKIHSLSNTLNELDPESSETFEIFNFIEGNYSQDQEVTYSSENQIDEDPLIDAILQ
jgi:hypothetical protein